MEIAAAIIIVEAAAITTAAITVITTVTIIIVITAAIIVVELVATTTAEAAAIMNVTTTAAETAAAATATAGVIGPDSGTDIIRVTTTDTRMAAMPAATLELCLLQLLLSMMAVVVVTPEVPVTNPSDFVMTSLSLCRQPPAGGTFFKFPCYFAGRKGYHTFLSLFGKK
ncbi:hypothetical protein D3Z55_15150 [Clostridiaceae bacterium]|nr:hypothetical protein [Clostridiaceae bacterium]